MGDTLKNKKMGNPNYIIWENIKKEERYILNSIRQMEEKNKGDEDES